MPKTPSILILIVLVSSIIGCASERNLIVLLPDNDGHVGQVVVSNSGGSQTLSEASQGTYIDNANKEPRAPSQIEEKKINQIFGAALAAEPQPPARYLLYFKSDSINLTSESKAVMPTIHSIIQERDSSDISVVGHTDTLGAKEYNIRLSKQRASAIAKLLTRMGVDPESLEVTSHGEGNPLIQTADNVSERRNRRVEVTVR